MPGAQSLLQSEQKLIRAVWQARKRRGECQGRDCGIYPNVRGLGERSAIAGRRCHGLFRTLTVIHKLPFPYVREKRKAVCPQETPRQVRGGGGGATLSFGRMLRYVDVRFR